ncbi:MULTISPECIES: hypothetical protein [Halobacterium]|uniref:hypothetical protein n=1 Tax=Halobacterium TaxID=2239 RepID=UPI000AD25A64|nr:MULTISPECIES: hypothetical protein [Halobacterium]MCG1004099.1 hypothetical protein [Halobacterium noricense]
MSDTAPCTKCGTEISTEIERCPECGYEPSASILGTLFFWFCALPFSVIFGLFIVGGFIGVIIGGLTATEFVGALFGFGVLGAVPFWYTRRYLRIRNLKATEEL